MSTTPPFPHHLFKAYDIRGVVKTALTPAMARRIGQSLGAEARSRGVGEFVIGRDGRLSGPSIAAAVTAGMRASGCDVLDIGMAPTPTLYFAAARHAGSGVQITASHNPPQDNGMKIMLAGDALFGDALQKIKQRVLDGDFGGGVRAGRLRREDALAGYQQAIVADIQLSKPLKVVIDCGNGVAAVVAPQVFRAIGCEVIELFCEVDGAFPNHHPDPSRPENLRDLRAAVRANNADFGMAFDGDGDRLGVVSSDGDIIWPDRQMLLFTESILAARPGAEIIFDVKCSQTLPRAIKARGGVASMCRTGHSFIKDKLKQTGAPFAGEMSGHLFFNDRWGGFDDAIYAGARLCELLAAADRPPGEVFSALPNSLNTPELLLDMNAGEPHALIEELLVEVAASGVFDDAVISRIDGIRVDFKDGFGLIRASNTRAALSLRFEASSQPQLAMIQGRFRRLLRAARADLPVPF